MKNNYICDVCDTDYSMNDIVFEPLLCCSKCSYPKCENFAHCGYYAEYKVDTIYGKRMFLCKYCEEWFTICNRCGKFGLQKDMTLLSALDDFPTCGNCKEGPNEKI